MNARGKTANMKQNTHISTKNIMGSVPMRPMHFNALHCCAFALNVLLCLVFFCLRNIGSVPIPPMHCSEQSQCIVVHCIAVDCSGLQWTVRLLHYVFEEYGMRSNALNAMQYCNAFALKALQCTAVLCV